MKKTIGELLNLSEEYLRKHGVDDAVVETENLLGWALEMERSELYLMRDKVVSEDKIDLYRVALMKRAKRLPFSYITGFADFYGLRLNLNEGCLIPRRETEILVDEVLKAVASSESSRNLKILDLGCGCGNISIAIAKNTENVMVYCVDISEDALRVTCQNAVVNAVYSKLAVYKGDIFSPFENNKRFLNFFDVIVSNPPYIPEKHIKTLQPEVSLYEPPLALSGGEDGLDFYRRIIPESKFFLKKGGFLALEIGYNQAENVKNILSFFEYKNINIVKDFGGNNRVAVATAA